MFTIDVITVIKLSCSTIRITSERVNIAYLNHVLTRCSFKFRNNLIIFVYHKQFEVKARLHSKSRHACLRHEHLRHACLGCLHINVFVHVSSIIRHLSLTIF